MSMEKVTNLAMKFAGHPVDARWFDLSGGLIALCDSIQAHVQYLLDKIYIEIEHTAK